LGWEWRKNANRLGDAGVQGAVDWGTDSMLVIRSIYSVTMLASEVVKVRCSPVVECATRQVHAPSNNCER
jgi:hypothetical protein